MVLFYCADQRVLSRARALLPKLDVTTASTWGAVERSAAGATCVVLLLVGPINSSEISRIQRLTARVPEVPIVLAVPKDPEFLRRLKRVPLEEVVWLERLKGELPSAVERARVGNFLERAARAFETAPHLPSKLRLALAHLCRTGKPIRSVTELARAIGGNRAALARNWRAAVGPVVSLRLEDFLHLRLLVAAALLRVSERNWSTTAAELRIETRILRRYAKTLVGLTLRQLAATGPSPVIRTFRSAVGRVIQ